MWITERRIIMDAKQAEDIKMTLVAIRDSLGDIEQAIKELAFAIRGVDGPSKPKAPKRKLRTYP
jgi:hypothetical protein